MPTTRLITYKKVLRTDKINQKGTAPISIQCYQFLNKKVTIRWLPTGIAIDPKFWDERQFGVEDTFNRLLGTT